MFFKQYMERSQFEKNASKTSSLEEELELISRVQKYNDQIAMTKLSTRFRGLIISSVRKSGVLSAMPESVAMVEAQNAFRDIIKRYDINNISKSKPNTFLSTSLTLYMKRIGNQHSGEVVHESELLRSFRKGAFTAKNMIERETNSSADSQQILDYMKNNMGITNKKLDLDHVNRITNYTTNNYSASKQISNKNADGAEALTFADIFNTSSNPEDFYEKELEMKTILDKLECFTSNLNEREFIKYVFGLKEYQNNKAKSINFAAIKHGITYHNAKKIISKFKEFIGNEKL